MLTERTNAALKEWAIVCRALGDGRQTILIRKGGTQEVKDGFQVTHRDFWLFPTYVHQKAADLVPAVHAEFEAVRAAQPPPQAIPLQLCATVEDVVEVTDLDRLQLLRDEHILSWECLASRFHYWNRPGVHVLTLRVYRRPQPLVVPNTSWYDGCVSWVDLDEAPGTDGCAPVIPDGEFAARLADIRSRLSGTSLSA